jgi:hypothetical protein
MFARIPLIWICSSMSGERSGTSDMSLRSGEDRSADERHHLIRLAELAPRHSKCPPGISSRTVLISRTWKGSRETAPIPFPAIIGNTHSYSLACPSAAGFRTLFPLNPHPVLFPATSLPLRHLRPVARMIATPSHRLPPRPTALLSLSG